MSFFFNIGYRTPISSFALNEKLHEVWGRNGVLSGFEISKHSNNQVKINTGSGIVRGVKIDYHEDNAGNPLRVNIPLNTDGKKYVYGLYNHKVAAFTLHATDGKYDAQGEWKLFLGHVEVSGGAIIKVQPIVPPSIVDIESIYKRIPNMNEIINLFYETTVEIENQIVHITNGIIGDMKKLKTKHKATVVGSVNELFDTKEPTLSRDRILELLGGGEDGGNIDIGSINKIPVKNFVLKDRAINTPQGSGLVGGGDLSQDRALGVEWGSGENQVPRGTHNHSGFHLEKKFASHFGNDKVAAVYSQVAYYTQDASQRGILKITLPKGFTNAHLGIEIKGYDSGASSSAYTLQLGGITDSRANAWQSCTADILGKAPFKNIAFGRSASGAACILLGTSDTVWNKGSVYISQILASGEDAGSWNTGWTMEIIPAVENVVINHTPKIVTGGPQDGEYVPPNRAVMAGTGLLGGGSLSNDISLSVDFGTGANHVARGNHGHYDYLNKTMPSRNGILVTDGAGNIKVDPLIWDYELQRLSGVRDNIQGQIDNKANNGHGHGEYFPRSGGEMDGAVNMKWHWFNADNCNINGVRVTVSSAQPHPAQWGHVWIQLT